MVKWDDKVYNKYETCKEIIEREHFLFCFVLVVVNNNTVYKYKKEKC